MPNFPNIAADTPFNDAAILDAIVDALDERWRAAGSPGAGPRSVWFSVPESAGYTATGDYDEEANTTELAVSGDGAPAYPSWPGNLGSPAAGGPPRRIHVVGKGDFTWLSGDSNVFTVRGDASCAGAAISLAPAGNVIDANFWATLQTCVKTIVPCYLDSYAFADGFEGEPEFTYFNLDAGGHWLTAAGLENFPRRVRARGPCSLTYDAESDTTTVYDYGSAEPDFAAGHMGKRIDIFGVGQFLVASVVNAQTLTVNSRAEHPDTVVSILPDDPLDQKDAAFDNFGLCEVGDVQGPWLLYDLIAAMKPLEWTAADAGWANTSEPNARYGHGNSTLLATAKSIAEAAFSAGDPLTWDAGLCAVTEVDYWMAFFMYQAYATRQKAKAGWSVPPDSEPVVYDIDIYGLPSRPAVGGAPEFDGNGDFTAEQEDKLHLLKSQPDVTDRTGVTGDWFGGLDMPTWYVQSLPVPPARYRGYGATAYAVAKWHFTHTG